MIHCLISLIVLMDNSDTEIKKMIFQNVQAVSHDYDISLRFSLSGELYLCKLLLHTARPTQTHFKSKKTLHREKKQKSKK